MPPSQHDDLISLLEEALVLGSIHGLVHAEVHWAKFSAQASCTGPLYTTEKMPRYRTFLTLDIGCLVDERATRYLHPALPPNSDPGCCFLAGRHVHSSAREVHTLLAAPTATILHSVTKKSAPFFFTFRDISPPST
ncbi:hypothetical protein MDA_GLEAN10007081 [Myotis davidii]|uniref:Uncharacterized protein n=1 Tax=Myotis davidii TaxID=225400 RepID=L5LMG9_MYODS|nr:hypothetical protein MDA_GLEAN10007081 [Myotis davidii]